MMASSEIVTGALAEQIVQNTKLHLNLSQDAIVITEDKVHLCLLKHLGAVAARERWMAPAGVLLTLAVTFATTDFRDALWLSKYTWQAIFIIVGVLTAVWLVKSLWTLRGAPSVEDVVAVMKREGAAAEPSAVLSAAEQAQALPVAADT